MRNKIISIGALALVIGLLGYTLFLNTTNKRGPSSASDRGLRITTSFYPLYFFTTYIVGDKASVYNITPAGSEPHDYEPTTQDIAQIEDSQLLILNGGKLEAWGDKIKGILQGSSTNIITMSDAGVYQMIPENGSAVPDPHIWLDPVLAKKMVDAISVGVANVDPANAWYYQKNAQLLKTKLDTLDATYRHELSTCQKKNIITAHAAFGYLAREYGLNQVAISGLSPDAEPSPEQLAYIADFAKKNNIKYIFFESLVSPRLSQTIANEVGAETLVLNPIEGLTDADIAQGKTYFTEMEHNLQNLKIALQCQ